MQWTGLNTLREKYLSFYESKGHLRLPSFSLVPNGDASLLLINSGMAPMKKYFTGEITPPRKRVTTCQKCIRTPDIERVGKTARHGTFFEMLGNFSFGDYFKHEAIAWAWEFCTKVMELPIDRIHVSIYQDDEQAYDIWTREIGVQPDHVVRLGKEDNFWEHGTGPCGPCSELYFDRGEKYGCGSPTCGVGCDCDRYVEFWNLVFTQFDSDGAGNYAPLDHPNIDTGMGLERLACIMQGVDNLFEVDTVQNIMRHVSDIAGVKYHENERQDVSLRVITDHIRSTVFMIGDGVMPSNEGRGYVLRRLLRRAARHGRLLGIQEPFLYQVAQTVIRENQSAYPELTEKQEFIQKLIHTEEVAFGKTIDSGLTLLDDMLKNLNGTVLSGADAFKLYDTYGFPLDLTEDILSERGMTVDADAFVKLMQEQKERARSARKDADADAWKGGVSAAEKLEKTAFAGYETLTADSKIIALLQGDDMAESVAEGETAAIVLDITPFYAESGGQVGDRGTLVTANGRFRVENTVKTHSGVIVHSGTMESGALCVGDTVTAQVCEKTRHDTMRHHTAAHLLQAALRQVLGTHVQQAGQLVDDTRMRFDFTHFSAMTAEELAKTEALVNDWILQNIATDIREMPIAEAKKLGAMALFGEKYGEVVRVVSVPEVSVEFCGGTHVSATGELGLFRILSESSVAAGVRRIEAVTGRHVLELMNRQTALMQETAGLLKAGRPEDIARRAEQVMTELKTAEKALEQVKAAQSADTVRAMLEKAETVGNVRLVTAKLPGLSGDAVRALCESCRDIAEEDAVVVLAGVGKETVTLGCYCAPLAIKAGVNAGKLVRDIAALCGGKGGGRPDIAMAGGKDIDAVPRALESAAELVRASLKN